MKPREMYRITAVRLVEFHNLGTTTIEISEGGHLFLLGDNGSGKTTILDAIHLVLTAGREMEFNSAARVAGAKDSGGRTIQGIVLRYNAVTGKTVREAGITYAAVELRSDAGRVCSLAIGLSASGMDVAYERWGGIASVPVKELPIMIPGTGEHSGKMRPASQGEFKTGMASLTGGKYYAHINDYADAVGVRLFGGEAKYADVCKLLRTGKAYREIAARAANYDDLFRQLLEDPSRDTFEPLLKGLREIEESKGKLDQIDERATYLGELRHESERLEKLRLKADVTSWCEESRKRAEAERTVQSLSEAESRERVALAAAESECATLKGEAARLRERLAELRAKDKTGLIDREKASAQRFTEANRKAVEAERVYAEMRRMADAAEKAERDARAKRSVALRKCGDDLITSGKSANFAVGGIADALYGAAAVDGRPPAGDFSDLFAEVRSKVAVEREARSDAAFHARAGADAAVRETDARRAELAVIRARGENLPEVAGFEEVRAEIRSQMLRARPVYELVEPASGCDARHLALFERLVGDEFLATWLVRPEEADQVRRIAWAATTSGRQQSVGSTIAVRGEACDVSVNDVAPWLGTFVSFEESDVEAIGLLARHLAAKIGPMDGDFLSQKTWLFRGREGMAPAAKPRLIGRKAREAEQARREKEAEVLLAEAEKAQKAAEKTASSCADALAHLKKLEQSLDAAREVAWREANTVRGAAGEAKRTVERATLAGDTACERRGDANAAHEELEDIRVKMRAEGIDGSLEKRIASAEKAVRSKENEAEEKNREIGGVRVKLEGLAKAREAKENEAADATTRAESFKVRFEALIPEGIEIFAFAAAECPQCVEEGVNFAALREQFVKEAGATEAKIEQRVRDQKGEAYAFSFDRAANRITDRRGSPLADVLQDEKRRLDELRGVLDQKSREVFERIFMGEVMRRLYMDLLRITGLTGRIQRKLAGRRFGSNRYAFAITPVPEYEHFIELVRKGYALDSGGEKDELREYLAQHREEILNAEIDTIPDIFDYRKWFRFELKVVTENEEGRVIDRKVKSMGSGGEQAVPNYLLILTVAEFLYHGGDGTEPPKASPILFDEAFYGIDAARRDQLLAFADDLGLQLFVSSPDQDGVKREIRHSVSLIVIKDENLDVHLTPVVWRNTPTQADLLGGDSPEVGMTVKEETK